MNSPTIWGVHMGEHVGTRPIDEGYVAIGWQELGYLKQYPDREAFKAAIAEKTPEAKTGVNGRVKVSQRAAQNVATLGLARLPHECALASGRPRFS